MTDQAVSRQAYDEAQASRLSAEAALEKARIDLRYTKVLAPFPGASAAPRSPRAPW